MHLEQVNLVASGIATAPEVFNEILRDHESNNGLLVTEKRPVEPDAGAASTSPTVATHRARAGTRRARAPINHNSLPPPLVLRVTGLIG